MPCPHFFESNRLGGVDYRNPDYDDAEAEAADLEGLEYEIPQYLRYPDNPSTRSFIITDEEIFNSIFAENTIEVDFEKEMVLLYMFETGTSTSRNYKIEEITVEEGEATVSFTYAWDWEKDLKHVKDHIYPYHRCIAVKMKKTGVTTANFIRIK